jgi:hypothetical protein
VNAHLRIAQDKFLDLYREQRESLAKLPKRDLVELHHESDDLRRSPAADYSQRVAGEMVFAATTQLLGK